MTLSVLETATMRGRQKQKRRRVMRLRDCRKQRLKLWQRTLVRERPGRMTSPHLTFEVLFLGWAHCTDCCPGGLLNDLRRVTTHTGRVLKNVLCFIRYHV